MTTWREWLRDALTRRRRIWGSRNHALRHQEPDYSHGSPAFKRTGHWPLDAKPIVPRPEASGRLANQYRNRSDESLK